MQGSPGKCDRVAFVVIVLLFIVAAAPAAVAAEEGGICTSPKGKGFYVGGLGDRWIPTCRPFCMSVCLSAFLLN